MYAYALLVKIGHKEAILEARMLRRYLIRTRLYMLLPCRAVLEGSRGVDVATKDSRAEHHSIPTI